MKLLIILIGINILASAQVDSAKALISFQLNNEVKIDSIDFEKSYYCWDDSVALYREFQEIFKVFTIENSDAYLKSIKPSSNYRFGRRKKRVLKRNQYVKTNISSYCFPYNKLYPFDFELSYYIMFIYVDGVGKEYKFSKEKLQLVVFDKSVVLHK
jgi:uncharacterized protein involved in tolerance to divalent cations